MQCDYLKSLIFPLKQSPFQIFTTIFTSLETCCSTWMSSVNSATNNTALQAAFNSYRTDLSNTMTLVGQSKSQYSTNMYNFYSQMYNVYSNLSYTNHPITQADASFSSLYKSIAALIKAFYNNFNFKIESIEDEYLQLCSESTNRLNSARNLLTSTPKL